MKNKISEILRGRNVLITAGPTHEAIDPVRYISNYSTGKMGYALAEACLTRGAEVSLISGPVHLAAPENLLLFQPVISAEEMYRAAKACFEQADIVIFSAAVADYRPAQIAGSKIKSHSDALELRLEKTTDIAFELGKRKRPGQFLVGFALETENELEHARQKMEKKNLDLIVLNSLNDKGAGFAFDTNKVSVIDRDNKIHNFGLKLKTEVANDIIQLICEKLDTNEST